MSVQLQVFCCTKSGICNVSSIQAGCGHLAEPEELHGSLIVLALLEEKKPAVEKALEGVQLKPIRLHTCNCAF